MDNNHTNDGTNDSLKPLDENSTGRPATTESHLGGKREIFRALFLCVAAVVAVRSFIFEPFKIPSSSMVPTLRIGDHIFVSKYNYGLSIPFSKIEIVSWSAPKRGDIIVFLFPRDESLHYIKRVVGVPGDKLEFKGKDLYINGEVIKREPVTDPKVLDEVLGAKELGGELYKETIGSDVHYIRHTHSSAYEITKAPQVEIVPEGKFFVMGDNRDDSYDSRSWGFVPKENIKGRAQIVWLSLDQDQSWGKTAKVRWSRCGTLIH